MSDEPVEISWILRSDGNLPRVAQEMEERTEAIEQHLRGSFELTQGIRREMAAMNRFRRESGVASSGGDASSAGKDTALLADLVSVSRQQLRALQAISGTGGSGASPATGRASSSQAPPSKSQKASYLSGPYQRLARAQENLKEAQGAGADSSVIKDAEEAVRQALKSVKRVESPAGPKPPKPTSYLSGPYQRLAKAEANLKAAQSGAAGPDAIRDAALAVKRAKSSVEGLEKKPEGWSGLLRVAASSRFSLGPGGASLSPLVGETMSALGATSAAGPAALAVAGAVALAQALYSLASDVTATSRAFAEARDIAGGTRGETARLGAIGGAIGMSPQQIAGVSRAISERIASDPMAAGAAQRFGAFAYQGPYGTVDSASNLLKIVQGLRSIKSDQERLMTARAIGAEELLPMTRLSQRTNDKLMADARITESIQTPEQAQRAAEFQASLSRMAQAKDNLMGALSGPMIDDMTTLFNQIADIMNATAKWASDHKDLVKFTWDMMVKPRAMYLSTGIEALRNGFSGGSGLQGALDANTAAMEGNTAAISSLTRMVGGAERARGALPEGQRGMNLIRAMETGYLPQGVL